MTVLSGKTAIVTGAAQGIGAVYARALAAAGARVCLSDILDTADAVQAVKDDGGEAIGMSLVYSGNFPESSCAMDRDTSSPFLHLPNVSGPSGCSFNKENVSFASIVATRRFPA